MTTRANELENTVLGLRFRETRGTAPSYGGSQMDFTENDLDFDTEADDALASSLDDDDGYDSIGF